MRYRRLSYRYAVVLTPREPRLLGNRWGAGLPRVMLAQPQWCPPTDVYETPAAVTVTVELAGVDDDDLDMLLYDDAVVIEGTRRLQSAEPGGVYHAAEIRQGPFRLEVPLPAPVDAERIDARYERGMLRLRLAKIDGR